MMDAFFSADFQGPPFELFGPLHLTTLALLALIGAAVIVLGCHYRPRTHFALRYCMSAPLFGNEIS